MGLFLELYLMAGWLNDKDPTQTATMTCPPYFITEGGARGRQPISGDGKFRVSLWTIHSYGPDAPACGVRHRQNLALACSNCTHSLLPLHVFKVWLFNPSYLWNTLVPFKKFFFDLKWSRMSWFDLRGKNLKTQGKITGLMSELAYELNLPSTEPNHIVWAGLRWKNGKGKLRKSTFSLDSLLLQLLHCPNIS